MFYDAIFYPIAIFAGIFGVLLCFRPSFFIAMQIRFYAMINWRIEPISMTKEIRNTKFMGLSMVIFDVLAVSYYVSH